jgi:hypothetical protein
MPRPFGEGGLAEPDASMTGSVASAPETPAIAPAIAIAIAIAIVGRAPAAAPLGSAS